MKEHYFLAAIGTNHQEIDPNDLKGHVFCPTDRWGEHACACGLHKDVFEGPQPIGGESETTVTYYYDGLLDLEEGDSHTLEYECPISPDDRMIMDVIE